MWNDAGPGGPPLSVMPPAGRISESQIGGKVAVLVRRNPRIPIGPRLGVEVGAVGPGEVVVDVGEGLGAGARLAREDLGVREARLRVGAGGVLRIDAEGGEVVGGEAVAVRADCAPSSTSSMSSFSKADGGSVCGRAFALRFSISLKVSCRPS